MKRPHSTSLKQEYLIVVCNHTKKERKKGNIFIEWEVSRQKQSNYNFWWPIYKGRNSDGNKIVALLIINVWYMQSLLFKTKSCHDSWQWFLKLLYFILSTRKEVKLFWWIQISMLKWTFNAILRWDFPSYDFKWKKKINFPTKMKWKVPKNVSLKRNWEHFLFISSSSSWSHAKKNCMSKYSHISYRINFIILYDSNMRNKTANNWFIDK